MTSPRQAADAGRVPVAGKSGRGGKDIVMVVPHLGTWQWRQVKNAGQHGYSAEDGSRRPF
jgi:hypothetical protein